MMRIRSAVVVAMMLAGGAAVAQEPAPAAAGPFPVMATMDRVTDHTDFNGSVAWGFYDDPINLDIGMRTDLGGQYLAPAGFGGYGALAVSFASGNDESHTAISNIELGGLYALPVG